MIDFENCIDNFYYYFTSIETEDIIWLDQLLKSMKHFRAGADNFLGWSRKQFYLSFCDYDTTFFSL